MAVTLTKVKLRSKENKVTELKQHGNIAFQLLVKSQQGNIDIDLQELMAYGTIQYQYHTVWGQLMDFLLNRQKQILPFADKELRKR